MRKDGLRLSFIKPMEPERFDDPPAGSEWSHEIKFDG
ncbi:MAG: DNA ligase, partial [Mesorhizobium sp.]